VKKHAYHFIYFLRKQLSLYSFSKTFYGVCSAVPSGSYWSIQFFAIECLIIIVLIHPFPRRSYSAKSSDLKARNWQTDSSRQVSSIAADTELR